jgi:hypothetical protein
MVQSSGPTDPKWGRPAPLPWPAGQGLTYFRKLFHTRVTGGWWSRLVMPKVGEGREHWPTDWLAKSSKLPQACGGDPAHLL